MSRSDCHIRETSPAVFRAVKDARFRRPAAASARRRLPARPSPGAARPRGGRRDAHGGFGARRLGAVLLAGFALLVGTGSARAQTDNPDGSATIWTATMIVSSSPGALVNFGYFQNGNGSLVPNSFTWRGNTLRVTALGIATVVSCENERALQMVDLYGGNWSANSETRWALHLDDHTFDFADADEVDNVEVEWCDVSVDDLGWADGDTVDVKITRKAGEPIEVPDGHPVIWRADIEPESKSDEEGWNADGEFELGLLSGPVSFEYKDGSYEVTGVYSTPATEFAGPSVLLGYAGSAGSPELPTGSDSNLTLHVGSDVFAASGASGASPLQILWADTTVTWPDEGINVGLSTSEPGPPGELSATTASDTSVTLDWIAPEQVGGSAITGYAYRRSADSGASWGDWSAIANSATLASHLVTGLHADTTYTFQLRAANDSGSGLHSATAEQGPSDTEPSTPTVASVALSDAGADGAYGIGDSVSVTVTSTFSGGVT